MVVALASLLNSYIMSLNTLLFKHEGTVNGVKYHTTHVVGVSLGSARVPLGSTNSILNTSVTGTHMVCGAKYHMKLSITPHT